VSDVALAKGAVVFGCSNLAFGDTPRKLRFMPARELFGLVDPFLPLDAAVQCEMAADPFDILRGPSCDLVEMPDAQSVQASLILFADAFDAFEIVRLIVAWDEVAFGALPRVLVFVWQCNCRLRRYGQRR